MTWRATSSGPYCGGENISQLANIGGGGGGGGGSGIVHNDVRDSRQKLFPGGEVSVPSTPPPQHNARGRTPENPALRSLVENLESEQRALRSEMEAQARELKDVQLEAGELEYKCSLRQNVTSLVHSLTESDLNETFVS